MRSRTVLLVCLSTAAVFLAACEEPREEGPPDYDRPPSADLTASGTTTSRPGAPGDIVMIHRPNFRFETGEIYAVRGDGSRFRRVTRSPVPEFMNPRVAPEGDGVYYMYEGGNSVTKVVPGQENPYVSVFSVEDHKPKPFDRLIDYAVSFDGRKLALTGKTGGNLDKLYVYDIAAKTITRVNTGDLFMKDATWTPDGRIVFSFDKGIAVVDPNQGGPTKLFELPAGFNERAWAPDVSSDGSRIAFQHVRVIDLLNTESDIMVMDIDGSDPRNITDSESDDERKPTWAPDGSEIAFSSGGDILAIAPDGSGRRDVAKANGFLATPDWGDLRPAISVNDVTVDEGDNATFTVTLSEASETQVTVLYSTQDGTARAGDDYDAKATDSLQFAPGETSKTVTVSTNQDTLIETSESFLLKLASASGGVIADGTGRGHITDDDEPTPSPSPSTSSSSPPPTGSTTGKIAFVRYVGGLGQLYSMLPNGTDVKHVSPDQASSHLDDPSWSGDGLKLIYSGLNGGQSEILERPSDGTGSFSLLITHPSQDVDPVYKGGSSTDFWWSSNEHGDFDLFRGPGRNHMTTSTAQEQDPSFGSDPLEMVFEADYNAPGDFDIFLQLLSSSGQLGGSPVNLTQEGAGVAAAADIDPDMSADGTKVVFSSDREGSSDIFIVDVATKAVTRLTSDPAAEYAPTFSPNGQQVAFVREVNGDPEIFRMNATAGATAVNISNNPGSSDTNPEWGPASSSSQRTSSTGAFALPVLLASWVTIRRMRDRRPRRD